MSAHSNIVLLQLKEIRSSLKRQQCSSAWSDEGKQKTSSAALYRTCVPSITHGAVAANWLRIQYNKSPTLSYSVLSISPLCLARSAFCGLLIVNSSPVFQRQRPLRKHCVTVVSSLPAINHQIKPFFYLRVPQSFSRRGAVLAAAASNELNRFNGN